MKKSLNWGLRLRHIIKRPKVILKVAKRYLQIIAFKQKPLRTVQIAIDYECNANCVHCSSEALINPNRKKMSLDTIKELIDQCVSLGTLNFALSGGEPLLYPYLEDIIRYIKQKGVFSNVITNGILLTREKALSLKNAGLDVIYLSLEGFSDVHDSFYGIPGLFNRSVGNMIYAKSVGIDTMVLTVATNESLESGLTAKLADFLYKNQIDTWILYPSVIGKWANNEAVLLTDENRKRYRELLKNPWISWEGDANYLKDGCPAGTEVLYITAYGDICPCPFIHLSYGNIHETTVKEALDKMRNNEYFSYIHDDCLVGTDKEFYRKHIDPFRSKEFPIQMTKE